MMKLVFTLSVAWLCLSFSSTKTKEFVPPGTVQINDTLFADETEISNFSWREFEFWTMTKYGKNSKEHLAVLPDTLIWRQANSFNEPYVQYYYRHPAYKDYPVVGISYEQALKFCKWRTERVKEFCSISKKYQNINFQYRLPSIQEWESFTYNGQFEFSNNGKDEKGYMKMNVRRETVKKFDDDKVYDSGGVDVTAPVYSYKPNLHKMYNLIGNVAEMVNEQGVAKGGGWINLMEECRVGKQQNYNAPAAWLGFRCVCVVRK
jgi:formylglycine-generating enzyme required for sulfatase activity